MFMFFFYSSSFPIKMLATDVKMQKIELDLNFFQYMYKIWMVWKLYNLTDFVSIQHKSEWIYFNFSCAL